MTIPTRIEEDRGDTCVLEGVVIATREHHIGSQSPKGQVVASVLIDHCMQSSSLSPTHKHGVPEVRRSIRVPYRMAYQVQVDHEVHHIKRDRWVVDEEDRAHRFLVEVRWLFGVERDD